MPRWVWAALAVAAAWHFALSWHAGQVKTHDAAIRAEQDSIWTGLFDAERASANDWKSKFEAAQVTIATKTKEIHDAQVRSNASDAGDLRLHGPGRAAAEAGCRPVDHPAPGAGSSGHSKPAAQPDVAGPQVPADDWSLVPWSWLVERAEEHDDLLSEANAWRSNDRSQRALQEQELKSAPQIPAPAKP